MSQPRGAPLSEVQSTPRARATWRAIATDAWHDAASLHAFSFGLIQPGFQDVATHTALRVVRDAVRLAGECARVHAAADAGASPFERPHLKRPRRGRGSIMAIEARQCVDLLCVRASFEERLARARLAECVVPIARATCDAAASDLAVRRDFGWALLASLLDRPGDDLVRAAVVAELPLAFGRLRARRAEEGDEAALTLDERAWGLLSSSIEARVLRETLEGEHAPRLARLGLDVQTAWAAAGDAERSGVRAALRF